MKPRFLAGLLLLTLSLFCSPSRSGLAQAALAAITQPGGGEALQGVVTVQGTTGVAGFQSAEIAFAYQSDSTNTWFLIQQSAAPVTEGLLASWDTTTITDGDYRLRLRVYLQDGQVIDAEISGLRVRNYSPVETSTPVPTGESTPTRQASQVPTRTSLPEFTVIARTLTPAPTNPVVVSAQRLRTSALQGTAVTAGLLALGALYAGLRKLLRK